MRRDVPRGTSSSARSTVAQDRGPGERRPRQERRPRARPLPPDESSSEKAAWAWCTWGSTPRLSARSPSRCCIPQFATQKEVVSRFFTEAQVVNEIEHENIINITDFVELDDGHTVFLVMELLKGHDLGDDIKQKGPIDPLRLIFIAQQVCQRAARGARGRHHSPRPEAGQHLPHRAFSGYSDFVKLLDFGIAKLTGGGGHQQDQDRHGARHALLHVAGAVRRHRDRSSQRYLFAGRHHVRVPHRARALQGGDLREDSPQAPHRDPRAPHTR